MSKKKYQPPAKAKYDKSHPILSIRVTSDLVKKLKDIKIMSDRGPADPYSKGYLTAEMRYSVNYNCSVCGQIITISTPDERKAMAQYMKEHGWGHSECVKK